MNVQVRPGPIRSSRHEAAQRDLLLQIIVERTERAAAWGRILLVSAAVLVFFLSADWERSNEPMQAVGEMLVALLAIAFSWWVLRLTPQRRVAQSTVLMSVTTDGLLAFGSLFTNVLDPNSDYTGVLASIDVSIALLLIVASAFRMRFSAVAMSAAVNGAGVLFLTFLNHEAGYVPPPNKPLIFLLYFIVAVSFALMAIYLARLAVGEAAVRTLREERARQGVRAMLHEHHDLKSLMSDVRLSIERIVERTSNVAGVEPLARRVSSRIEGFGESLDLARGRVLAILEGNDLVKLADVHAAIAQVNQQLCDNVRLNVHLPPAPVAVRFLGGTEAMALLLGHLVFNAIKGHGGRGAQCISIVVAPTDPGWLEIRVEDNGPGFSPTFLGSFVGWGSVSEPLRGLSLASSAVREVGGTLQLQNLASGGAQVTLRLPLLTKKMRI
jgi:signal transduction histidine kinase